MERDQHRRRLQTPHSLTRHDGLPSSGRTPNSPSGYHARGDDLTGIRGASNNLESGPHSFPIPAQGPCFAGVTESSGYPSHVGWRSQDPDLESQTSTAIDGRSRVARMSKAFSKPFTTWARLRGEGKPNVGWLTSLKVIATYSWLNVLLVFVPVAGVVQFSHLHAFSHVIKFALCFIAIIPLSKLLHFGGEQLALYCGRALGDLIVITLYNLVETVLALVLLLKCELKLLQTTITGVVLLRLLFVPGFTFLTGGARVLTQELHPHIVQLNNTLLTLGALTLLLPASLFGTLDRIGPVKTLGVAAVSDSMRGNILKISRGLAIFMLIIYICSRFYLHKPPGDVSSLHDHPDAPESFKVDVENLEREEPCLNPWVCIIMLLVTVVLVGFITECLTYNIHPMGKNMGVGQEWFGLFLLPLVSYSADGILSTVYFIHHAFRPHASGPSHISTLAQGRSIDLGIQFLMFWTPSVVMIGWFSHKPMSLLFDFFEVAVLLGACFLVNYVTADAKTNWAEGVILVTFYLMIALTAWFYPGQTDVHDMLACASVRASNN